MQDSQINKEQDWQKQLTKSLKKRSKSELIELKWLLKNPDFKEKPVDVETFCKSPNYLCLTNKKGKSQVRDRIMFELKKIFPLNEEDPFEFPYQDVVFAGGIGVGKSFVVSLVITYCTYLFGCLKDPQEYFGMSPGSAIQMMNMANNEVKARKIVFGEVKARVDTSPWFKNRFNYKQEVTSELRFPNNIFIIPGNSADTFFEGFNIFGGIIDEADSHTKTPEKDFAQVGYDAIKERIRSRFGRKGILMTIGSPKVTDGFLMRRFYESKKMERSYSVIIPYWECPSPAWDYSGKTFKYKGITIPIEHEEEFKRNPEKALRDIAAVPTFAHQPFFAYPEKVDENADMSRVQVRTTNDYPFYEPGFKADHKKPCVIHVDIGLNKQGGDKTGFAMGHSNGYANSDDGLQPMIYLDLIEQIKAPPGGEVLISDIRKRIFELRERGFRIVKVTFDGFQSAETIQILNKNGIKAERISVDRDTSAYEALKDCIYQERLNYPPNPVFIKECKHLEFYGDKVDHQPEGSKDVSDAVAGVVYNIILEPKKYNKREFFKPLFGHRRLTSEETNEYS